MKPVIGPIIGDNEGQDKLVGKYGHYGKTNCLCCYCNTPFDETDNPYFLYDYTKQEDIVKIHQIMDVKDSRNKLNEISYHHVPNNAFHQLDLGSDSRGINGICPAEVLHTLWMGIFKYTIEEAVVELSDKGKKMLNQLVFHISMLCSYQSDRDVPRTMFKNGITTLSKVTGAEHQGVLIVVTICLLCDEGR